MTHSESHNHTAHNHAANDRHERIAAIAYSIWESEGRPHGRSHDHWLEACAIDQREHGETPGFHAGHSFEDSEEHGNDAQRKLHKAHHRSAA